MRFPVPDPFIVTFLILLVASTACAQTWDITDLRGFTGLTAVQWKAVNQGEVQVRVVDTKEKREVAVIGVARLEASTAYLVSRFQDIEKFKENPALLGIRKFVPPAGPQDLERFGLEAHDLSDLSNCRIGACNVNLSARMLERLAHGIDWSRPDGATAAQSVFRDEVLHYLETYLRDGNPALIEYQDKSKPVRLAEDFREVLDADRASLGLLRSSL
jgi:hypothetical protein